MAMLGLLGRMWGVGLSETKLNGRDLGDLDTSLPRPSRHLGTRLHPHPHTIRRHRSTLGHALHLIRRLGCALASRVDCHAPVSDSPPPTPHDHAVGRTQARTTSTDILSLPFAISLTLLIIDLHRSPFSLALASLPLHPARLRPAGPARRPLRPPKVLRHWTAHQLQGPRLGPAHHR